MPTASTRPPASAGGGGELLALPLQQADRMRALRTLAGPPRLRPVLVVEGGQDRDPLAPVQSAQPPGQLRPCPASAGEQKTPPSTANAPGAT